jgi:Domain of unknown function (DUF4440)
LKRHSENVVAEEGTIIEDVTNAIESAEVGRIRATERERLRALVEANVEAAGRLHAADFQLVTPTGRVLSRDQYLDNVASGEINYFVWEPDSEIAVRLYGQAALLRYRSVMEMGDETRKVVLRCWHIDAYEKRNGRWQAVWSQATEIQGA